MDKRKRKEAIIAEYLAGGVSLRELGKKHRTNHRTIHRWVEEFRKEQGADERVLERMRASSTAGEDEVPEDIGQLKKELREAQLYNKLLNAMIDIAEEQMGVQIRKKRGAKR